jgi:amiloride-sensitive sodium channel subunit gamma
MNNKVTDLLNTYNNKESEADAKKETDSHCIENEINDASKKTKKSKIKEEIVDWCLSTTSHGIPAFVRNQNKLIKVIWALSFLASSCFCAYLLVLSTIDYFNFPVSTSIKVITEQPAQFPTVTLCNLNPFNYENPFVIETVKHFSTFNQTYVSSHPLLYMGSFYKLTTGVISNLTANIKKAVSIQLHEMLIFCRFNLIECTANEFEWFFDFDYGNCYKFNPSGSKYVGKNGVEAGLQLELYVGNSSSENLVHQRGIRVLVHNYSEKYLFMKDDGMNVAPGFQSSLSINRVFYNKKSKPYSECIDDLTINNPYKTRIMVTMFNELNQTQYSQKYCQKLCYQIFLIKACNCSDPTIPRGGSISLCLDSTQSICQSAAFDKYYSNPVEYCSDSNIDLCPKECFRTVYDTQFTKSGHINEDYWTRLQTYFLNFKPRNGSAVDQLKNQLFKNKLSQISSIDEARNSILLLNVYYSETAYVLISESAVWTANLLMSNYGGQLGLFVGMSFLSFIEIFELIIKLLFIFFSKREK